MGLRNGARTDGVWSLLHGASIRIEDVYSKVSVRLLMRTLS